MKISAINSSGLKKNFKNSQVQTAPLAASGIGPAAQSSSSENNQTKTYNTKNLVYAAGIIVLAGIGAYVFRDKLGFVKKAKDKLPQQTPKPDVLPPGGNSGSLGNDTSPLTPLQRVIDFNKSKAEEVKKIIEGYTGRLDGKFLKNMEQRAISIAFDTKKEKPLHEAANLLEQTYITQFLHGNASQKEGIDHIFSRMKGEGSLITIYGKMPFEEFTARLENLRTNEFAAQSHKGMTPEKFVNKVTRLIKREKMHQNVVDLSIAARFNEAADHLESFYGKRYQQIQNPTADDLKHLVTSVMNDPSSHIVYGIEGNASRLYNLNKKYFDSKIDPQAAKKVVDETFAKSLLRYTLKVLGEQAPKLKVELFKPASVPSMRNFIKYKEKPTAWLIEFNNKKMGEVTRIINENKNLHGNDYLNMMEKIAMDFSLDKNREKPLHEAANFLEQAYLRHYLKGDDKVRIGIDKMFDRIQVNDKLMRIYRQMPVEEAVARLENLKLTALKADKYTGISAEKFVDKVGRLLIQQNLRNETKQLLAAGKADEAAAVLENYYAMRLLQSEKNTPQDYKRFVQAIVNDKEFTDIYKNAQNDYATRVFSFNEKYFYSQLNPEITDKISFEILDKFIMKTLNEKGRSVLKENKPSEAADYVEDFLIEYLNDITKNPSAKQLENLTGAVVLKEIYSRLPETEVVQRVKKLQTNILKSLNTEDKKAAQEFLDNLTLCAHKDSRIAKSLGIDTKGIYDSIMRSNQNLRVSAQEILNGLKDSNGRVKLTQLDAKARELMNQGKTTEAAYLMEQSLLEYYKFGAVETPVVYKTASRAEQSAAETAQEAFINIVYKQTPAPSVVKLSPNFEQLKNSILSNEGKTLFEIYSRLPKEEAAQRCNVFRRNYLTSNFSNVSVKDTEEFYKQLLTRLSV